MNFSNFLKIINSLKNILFLNRDFFNKYLFQIPSKERDEFIINWISKLPHGSKILDAGAGIQRYKKYTNHLNYVSQDFGEYKGGEKFLGEKVPSWTSNNCDIISDIANIPVKDDAFDFILCSEVLEHVESPEKTISELCRVIKPGGQLLITAPFNSYYHQTPYFFLTGFSKYWYRKIAENLNLELISITPNGNYIKDLAKEVIRTTYFGNAFFRILTRLVSLPYLIILFVFDKFINIKTPESCTGYFVIFRKI